MSRRKELKARSEAIDDMQSIVTVMKALAFTESKKLNRYLADQGRATSSVMAATSDFLSFYPFFYNNTPRSRTVLIAIGADRGFCGNFNAQVADRVSNEIKLAGSNDVATIAVGDRLASKLQPELQLAGTINGATFAEEVPTVLSTVLQLVRQEFEKDPAANVNLKILGHQYEKDGVCVLEPIAELGHSTFHYGSPPALTLSPAKLFPKLIDQYFQFVLYHAFYSSLMAENVQRLMHLDTALQRLERNAGELRRRCHQARQEEITEEIEILIMNIGADCAAKL